ncbi:unnamed protein product [Penicillium salamii]|uniref:ATP-grasp domain-containing protein n=1 Tax=Penicillium salamii TaxID=1612424 RepID=A0A9W4ITA3_9EURO|nr:unnamed protein product [Penicillium salamii]CAG8052352.1 unnamed protein product [Penicillium salamii]CAG8330132.1 unnamed protein product [Penicillium salamii]CAG8330358.1 unnamed protein product [Penicillium salamii]CAG8339077.1 unnamed protein product [Penicillium salamii]
MITWRSLARTSQFNLPVPKGYLVTTPEEAEDVVFNINAPSVIKAQILAGGRGKGTFDSDQKGGVRIVKSPREAYQSALNMLNHNLTTKQTPPSGLPVHKLYIYKAVDITHEYYLAITFDRKRSSPIILISDSGGVDIETSNRLHQLWFQLDTGITPEIDAYIQAELGFSDSEMVGIHKMLCDMVRLFREKDATLLELNPLVRTEEGFVCIDAKFEFDNSARFRQDDIFACEEGEGVEVKEVKEAEKLGLSYVKLDGNIGNIVNGAGLAMATNDLITLVGGSCANFLDVGGGATREGLVKAFRILWGDERVKGVLINIYGGIVRCDMIAESIIAAAKDIGGFKMPVVVRLQGTNAEKGLKLIEESGLENLVVEADFEKAAQLIVEHTPKFE